MFLIKNYIIEVGGADSVAGKLATNWNDENIRINGGAHTGAKS